MTRLARLRTLAGLATAQLRHRPSRTLLAVLGIALAVLATTLLASVGFGVLETGEQKFDAADRDLWITGGPIELAPGSVGGFRNTVLDSHAVAAEIQSREDVRTAVPMGFQTVYAGRDPAALETVVAVGVPGAGSSVQLDAGDGFSRGDVHYGNGSYDGPMTHEIIVDPRIAEKYGLEVGDELHVGGTVAGARDHEFVVVGISPTFSSFLGVPTVTMPLSELQELTGTTATDRATWITVAVADGADADAVETDLESEYPRYDVRTNSEQLSAILNEKAVLLAAGATLVALAVVAGLALTVNLLALVVYQQRDALAALKAVGLSSRTLVGVVAGQGVALGALGGAVGLLATPPIVAGLNRVAARLVGFEGLLRTPDAVFVGGAVIAVGIGTASAVAAGWQIARIPPLDQLRG